MLVICNIIKVFGAGRNFSGIVSQTIITEKFCEKISHVDASRNTAILTSSSPITIVMYPSYLHSFLSLLTPFMSIPLTSFYTHLSRIALEPFIGWSLTQTLCGLNTVSLIHFFSRRFRVDFPTGHFITEIFRGRCGYLCEKLLESNYKTMYCRYI